MDLKILQADGFGRIHKKFSGFGFGFRFLMKVLRYCTSVGAQY